MILHRDIRPDRPLLVVALEEEAVHLHVHELPILVTGVGKVNAAIAVSTILGAHRPSSIVNLGTAGALRDGVTGTHVISTVIQHDLNDAAIYDLVGIHFGAPMEFEAGDGTVLATGDRFISKPEVRERITALGAEPTPSDTPAFTELVKRQLDIWGRNLALAGIQPE